MEIKERSSTLQSGVLHPRKRELAVCCKYDVDTRGIPSKHRPQWRTAPERWRNNTYKGEIRAVPIAINIISRYADTSSGEFEISRINGKNAHFYIIKVQFFNMP